MVGMTDLFFQVAPTFRRCASTYSEGVRCTRGPQHAGAHVGMLASAGTRDAATFWVVWLNVKKR